MSLKQYHDREGISLSELGTRAYTKEEEKLMKEWRRKNKVLVIDGAKQKRVKMNKSL